MLVDMLQGENDSNNDDIALFEGELNNNID